MIVPAVYLIGVDTVLLLLRVLLVPQEVDVVAVFLRDRLDLGVPAAEHVLPPLLIVEGRQLNPALKVLILSLDDALLPFLVRADVVVLVETVMAMVFGLFTRSEGGLKLGF